MRSVAIPGINNTVEKVRRRQVATKCITNSFWLLYSLHHHHWYQFCRLPAGLWLLLMVYSYEFDYRFGDILWVRQRHVLLFSFLDSNKRDVGTIIFCYDASYGILWFLQHLMNFTFIFFTIFCKHFITMRWSINFSYKVNRVFELMDWKISNLKYFELVKCKKHR